MKKARKDLHNFYIKRAIKERKRVEKRALKLKARVAATAEAIGPRARIRITPEAMAGRIMSELDS